MARVKAVGQAGDYNQKTGPVRRFIREYFDRGRCDYSFLFLIIYLVLFGLVMMYCASLYTDSFFVKQRIFALVGICAMLMVSHLNYKVYRKLAPFILVFSLVLIGLLFTPFGVSINNSTRWLRFGPLQFQPAEVFKIAVIIFNASFLSRMGKKIRTPENTLIYYIMTLVEVAIVFILADNLSTALIVGAISTAMLFVARPNWKMLIFIVAVTLVIGVIVIAIYAGYLEVSGGSDFRIDRIKSWLGMGEESVAATLSDQVKHSLYAIGSGGIWGKGFGNSTQKMVLPEAMNDTVFAIVCEELGFVGASFVILSFAMLLYRMYIIIRNAKDTYGSFLVTGIFAHIAIQVVFNIAVVTNVIPTTGVTFPFFSYGGTALCILLAEMGIALNVSRNSIY